MQFTSLYSILALSFFAAADVAPLIVPNGAIPGKYIITLRVNLSGDKVAAIIKKIKSGSDQVYQIVDSFTGFAAKMTDDEVNAVRQSDGVVSVTQDATIILSRPTELDKRARIVNQPVGDTTWGLARISHRNNTAKSYGYDYSQGTGTCAYVLDTGIYVNHPDFGGRAQWLGNFARDNVQADKDGHGTHVAGIIGSNTYGVAKQTKLLAVKVLGADGTGSFSNVIDGLNFVANHYKKYGKTGCPRGAVANMSFGGGKTQAVNDAVAALVAAGIFVAVAAGNQGADASSYSPASTPQAFTVAALDRDDTLVSFSNTGTLVDIIAPGVDVKSTWNDGTYRTFSGTSMASPHVAGLAAYLYGLENLSSVAAVSDRITALATKNKIQNPTALKGTPNTIPFNNNPQG